MAMTGALYGGKCYASAAVAMHSYMSVAPLSSLPGATPYVTQYVYETGTWRQKQYSVATNGLWTLKSNVAVATPSFPLCDPAESFNDGVLIGWGIAIAMIAATAVNFLKRGARGG
jgi:hypothetical protein